MFKLMLIQPLNLTYNLQEIQELKEQVKKDSEESDKSRMKDVLTDNRPGLFKTSMFEGNTDSRFKKN